MNNFNILIQYILAIIGFSLIILAHELGHFTFAKISKIHVQEFFIGFGPKILKFKSKKSGTLYGLSAIPFGGYNRILGQDREEKIPEGYENKVFFKKPFYKKFLVIIGGGIFNIILTIILIAIYLSMGIFSPTNIINYVEPNSPADMNGFLKGDKVVAINNQKIDSWEKFSTLTKSYPDHVVTYNVIRQEKEIRIDVKLLNVNNEGFLGISPELVKTKMGFGQIMRESFKMTWDVSISYFKLFGMLFSGKIPFSEARPVSPIGVISIFQQSASMGFQNFVLFVALVSMLLAYGNFLPILPVDGGHLVILIIEAIKRKPVSNKVVKIYGTAGMVLVVSLLLVGLIFDIISPFKLPRM
jgi:regulator of sigma E protease